MLHRVIPLTDAQLIFLKGEDKALHPLICERYLKNND